jgi:hypothetical protein
MRYTILICVLLAIVGLVIGLLVASIAVGMCGAGHGWCSACHSVISVACAPIAGVVWELRRQRWSLSLSLPLVAIAIYTDIKILIETRIEGINYLQKMWENSPEWVVLWAVLFASWQLWAVFSMVYALRLKVVGNRTQ